MATYDVWYMRPEHYVAGSRGSKKGGLPDLTNLGATHVLLTRVEAKDPDVVFHMMKGELWLPKGHARQLIRRLGLAHTSMSIGDVVSEVEGPTYMVDLIGWTRVEGRKL